MNVAILHRSRSKRYTELAREIFDVIAGSIELRGRDADQLRGMLTRTRADLLCAAAHHAFAARSLDIRYPAKSPIVPADDSAQWDRDVDCLHAGDSGSELGADMVQAKNVSLQAKNVMRFQPAGGR